jgi:choline dehydrogenase-like flavoprotein
MVSQLILKFQNLCKNKINGNKVKLKKIKCDYLVVGSGAGGSVVADYLLEAGFSVLMIEEGEDYSFDNVPKSATDGMIGMWRGGGLTPAFGSPTIAYAEGCCLGGGTEINSGIMQRVPTSILAEWGKISKEDKNVYNNKIHSQYDWVEKTLNANVLDSSKDQHSQILKDAGDMQGWRVESLPRAMKQCFCKQPLCLCGARQSMTATLLKKNLLNKNFSLSVRTRAKKLILKNGFVNEVFAEQSLAQGGSIKIKIVPTTVFLCAGAIHTPHLLMKSGINFSGLGRFQLHPTLKILAHFKDLVNAGRQPLPNYAITEFMPDIRFGGSVVTPGVLGMALAENWDSRSHLKNQLDHLASYYVMIRPKSWGQIRSFKVMTDPLVTYKLGLNDSEQIAYGVEKLSNALFSVGALSLHPSIKNHGGWKTRNSVKTDMLNKKLQYKLNLMSIHLFSSCSRLNNPIFLLSNGRIKDISNVVLADASCLPSAPGVNPQATIMALARQNVIKYCKK